MSILCQTVHIFHDFVLTRRLGTIKTDSGSGSDSDVPLSQLKKSANTSDEEYDSDVPIKKHKKMKKNTQASKKQKATPPPTSSSASKSPSASDTKKTKKVKKETKKEVKSESKESSTPAAEEESQTYKWWEAQDNEDDSIKWNTLEHNGVVFPPEYEPLPSHVKLYYDGQPVDLPPEAEEVAGFFAALIETDHGKNPVFQKNFFNDFLQVLKEAGGCKNGVKITSFDKCDFTKIFQYLEIKKEEKKQLTSAEKKQIKLEKEKFEEPYKICLLNGRKEQVGNFRIEPPGLFRGRGAHPKTGKLKRRVKPEDVILNLGKEAKVPEPPKGHSWGEIRHDNTVSWLAMWRENISNSVKYVRFAANSSLKGMSDFKKFEKARELKKHIEVIRKDYKKLLKDELMLNRQIAVATYLIDVFALRAGGEKSEDEADTVGCCSLRYEHITLSPPNKVVFDFLGKDSIRFYQEVEVDTQVFKNLKIFKRAPKQPGDDLFDRLDPSILNKHFQKYMPGLTAKVFRTYNASKTMQDQLDLIENVGTAAEKVVKFNAANRTVAILCNHQRTVGKGHEASMQKIQDKIKEMVWQRIRCKKMMLQIDKKLKAKKPKFFEEIDDITKEDELELHKLIIEREREKYMKKFKRENDKRAENKEPPLPESELEEWLKKVDQMETEFKEEFKLGRPVLALNTTMEKLETQVEKLDKRIANTTLQMQDKEDNSQVALSTSKINYIDPRLSVMFCKKYDVPIEKIFTKTLRDKFNWAIESADENWRF